MNEFIITKRVIVLSLIWSLVQGYITIQNGYFFDSNTSSPFLAVGFSYQVQKILCSYFSHLILTPMPTKREHRFDTILQKWRTWEPIHSELKSLGMTLNPHKVSEKENQSDVRRCLQLFECRLFIFFGQANGHEAARSNWFTVYSTFKMTAKT